MLRFLSRCFSAARRVPTSLTDEISFDYWGESVSFSDIAQDVLDFQAYRHLLPAVKNAILWPRRGVQQTGGMLGLRLKIFRHLGLGKGAWSIIIVGQDCREVTPSSLDWRGRAG